MTRKPDRRCAVCHKPIVGGYTVREAAEVHHSCARQPDSGELLRIAREALKRIGDMSFASNQGSAEWRLDWCGKKASETLATLDGRNWRDG